MLRFQNLDDHQLSVIFSGSRILETLLGDDALPYITYVTLICPLVIPATRWSCSRPGLTTSPPADSNDCCLKLHLVAGIRGTLISITGLVLSALSL